MLKTVCLLKNENYATALCGFEAALKRKGIETHCILLQGSKISPEIFHQLKELSPDLICSFFQPEKLQNGRFLWDSLEIPYLLALDQPLIYYGELLESPFLFLAGQDRTDSRIAASGSPRAFFWPQGVDGKVLVEGEGERDLDVVYFGDCFDFIAFRKDWKKKLSPQLSWVMDFAMDIALINSSITLAEALTASCETAGMNQKMINENLAGLLRYFHRFMAGKERYELLHAVRDVTVHVYGSVSPPDLLAGRKNLVFHPPVSAEERVRILKRSKICLNSFPDCRDGVHPDVLEALCCGALPCMTGSVYLKETLEHGSDILYFKANHWLEVNEWLREYLAGTDKWKRAVASGQEKLKEHHSWDVRVNQLLQNAAPHLLR